MIRRLTVIITFSICTCTLAANPTSARGVVYHDKNANQTRDANEPGIADVCVSNGDIVVKTDHKGAYELPITDETIIFVIKPRDWMTPVNHDQLPRFYYDHKPAGSAPHLQYKGVAPTGELPASVDFPLVPHKEPNVFTVILFGDTQPRDDKEIDYIAHDVIDALINNTDAAFGVTLGDVVFDDLSIYDHLNAVVGKVGVPWYNVHGNHDMNFDVGEDKHSDETWERIFGPTYYAFDWGPAHFIVLDNITYEGLLSNRNYRGGLGEQQLAWIKEDLRHVPNDKLVVLLMHIPLHKFNDSPRLYVEDRFALYELLKDRPHTLSISAHTHIQQHFFLDETAGWQGKTPHHHFNAGTVSGSWWAGSPDEEGIPHTLMRCGAPNGYNLLHITDNKYKIDFVPARRPASHQMNIYVPDEIALDKVGATDVFANVFAGSEKSKVEMRVPPTKDWTRLTKTSMIDPSYQILFDLHENNKTLPGRPMPKPLESPHIWTGKLPANLPPGVHVVEIRTRDIYNNTFTANRIFRVMPSE